MLPYWQKASEHYLGKGLEEGLDWSLIRRMGKEYEQLGLTKHKHMLYTMVA